jgi:AcrR family transcriptional regulator
MGAMATASTRPVRTDRRAQILRAAKQAFSQKGFHSASVSDIIERAGIARGTFYLYFESKRDVFDKLLEDLLEELRQCIRPIDLAPGKPQPVEQLKANITRVLELVVREPELFQLLLHQARGLDAASAALVHAFYQRVLDLIERSLEHGMRLGLIRPCNTGIISACILGTVKEVAGWLTAQRPAPPDLSSLADEILGFGLRGLLAR